MFREATHNDVEDSLACAKNFINHYKMAWCEDSVRETLHNLVDCGYFYVAIHNSKIVGIAGAMLIKNPWNRAENIFQELFWWVEEEYRGYRYGAELLLALERAAPSKCTIALSILPDTPIKLNTLTKRGYSIKESAFIKTKG